MFSILVLNSEHIAQSQFQDSSKWVPVKTRDLTGWQKLTKNGLVILPPLSSLHVGCNECFTPVCGLFFSCILPSFCLLLANKEELFPFSVANLGPSTSSSGLIISPMKLTIHHYIPSYVTSFLFLPTTIYFITSFPFYTCFSWHNTICVKFGYIF